MGYVISPLMDIGSFILQLLLGLALIILILAIIDIRSSKKYRKFVMDMYVTAKTRFLAKEDNLDLDLESETFRLWLKKKVRMDKNFDLDESIEEELKERISKPIEEVKS